MPKLFLIRHAIAEDRLIFQNRGLSDDLRPLTPEGQKKMKKVSKNFQKLCPDIDLFCQSPLTRSKQTVDIVKSFYPKSKVKTLEHLAPGSSHRDLLDSLQKFKGLNLALVGHEDHLSQFLCYLLTGVASPSPFYFKKGGIACLSYKTLEPQSFRLDWLTTPKILS